MKKPYIAIVVLAILLYIALALSTTFVNETGELFGYILLGTIGVGVFVAIWVLVKPPKEKNAQ